MTYVTCLGEPTPDSESHSSQDERALARATQRKAAKACEGRSFGRNRVVDEQEAAVVSARRNEQEEEWRRLLQGKRGTRSATEASVATTMASRATAGLLSAKQTGRVASYGKMSLAMLPADL